MWFSRRPRLPTDMGLLFFPGELFYPKLAVLTTAGCRHACARKTPCPRWHPPAFRLSGQQKEGREGDRCIHMQHQEGNIRKEIASSGIDIVRDRSGDFYESLVETASGSGRSSQLEFEGICQLVRSRHADVAFPRQESRNDDLGNMRFVSDHPRRYLRQVIARGQVRQRAWQA